MSRQESERKKTLFTHPHDISDFFSFNLYILFIFIKNDVILIKAHTYCISVTSSEVNNKFVGESIWTCKLKPIQTQC